METTKPHIHIEPTVMDKLVEGLSIVGLVFIWAYVALYYSDLPDRIPMHYNLKGEADRWAGKAQIWVLPVIATFLIGGLLLLVRNPHLFNYPTAETPEEAVLHYRRSAQLLRWVGLGLALSFSILVALSIRTSLSGTEHLGNWVAVLLLAPILLPIIVFVVAAVRHKQKIVNI